MGARGTNNFGKAITDVEIEQYLDSRDDFELELFAVRTLKGNGWEVRHGGRYIDPVKGIGRQYDVRTWREFELGRRVSLAVECKSLSPEFPLVISRVPRPPTDVGHDVIVRRFNDLLGQEHVVHVGEDGFSYRLNHLLIFTRNGFTAWLQNCANPTGLVLFRIFESVVLQELR
jgi:hypothetical protein